MIDTTVINIKEVPALMDSALLEHMKTNEPVALNLYSDGDLYIIKVEKLSPEDEKDLPKYFDNKLANLRKEGYTSIHKVIEINARDGYLYNFKGCYKASKIRVEDNASFTYPCYATDFGATLKYEDRALFSMFRNNLIDTIQHTLYHRGENTSKPQYIIFEEKVTEDTWDAKNSTITIKLSVKEGTPDLTSLKDEETCFYYDLEKTSAYCNSSPSGNETLSKETFERREKEQYFD